MPRLIGTLSFALMLAAGHASAHEQTAPGAVPEPAWAAGMGERLAAAERRLGGEIGVFVHHLGRDESFSWRGDEPWYLASGIKVPVAIAVLRRIEDGHLALDAHVRLEADDYVDGAGPTNHRPPGSMLSIGWLMEQMLIHSDNTATDVLIRTVGLDEVNAVAHALLADRGLVITSLADVRRLVYAGFHVRAANLGSQELLALRRAPSGMPRVRRLAEILETTPDEFLLPDLDSAFDAYYAQHINVSTLRNYGRMLAALGEGLALGPEGTAWLLGVMTRVRTGDRRIKAALPAGVRFAHKTGTQHRRFCDLGIASATVGGREQQVVIAACARGNAGLAAGERALRDVGAAVTASGVLNLASP